MITLCQVGKPIQLKASAPSSMIAIEPWDRNLLRSSWKTSTQEDAPTFQPSELQLHQTTNAWTQRVQAAQRLLTSTTDGKALLDLARGQLDLSIRPMSAPWPSSFGEHIDPDVIVSIIGSWGARPPFGGLSPQQKLPQRTQNRAASLLRDARLLGRSTPYDPRALPLPSTATATASPVASGRPRAAILIATNTTDYDTWAAPEGRSHAWVTAVVAALDHLPLVSGFILLRWFQAHNVAVPPFDNLDFPTLVELGIPVETLKSVAAARAHLLSLPLTEAKVIMTAVQQQLTDTSNTLLPARRGMVDAIEVLMRAGLVPLPLAPSLAHEFVHAVRLASPWMQEKLANTAFAYVQSPKVRQRVDALYFGPSPVTNDFAYPSILAAIAKPPTLETFDACDDNIKLGVLWAAHRVIESAAVHGLAAVLGTPTADAPADADAVAKACWHISENSIRHQLGLLKRSSYVGAVYLPWLGCPAWSWATRTAGCTGGRYPWASDGLAKLVAAQKVPSWFN